MIGYLQTQGPIFDDVQQSGIYSDSKTFVDSIPVNGPTKTLEIFKKEAKSKDFDLNKLITKLFILPEMIQPSSFKQKPKTIEIYIEEMWNILLKKMFPSSPFDTLIYLPYPQIVPGGRFREAYYWDSYFVLIGLLAKNKHDLVLTQVQNFASILERYQKIPNGNRVYFLSRSQPPFFSHMLMLLYENGYPEYAKKYAPHLEQEYLFWMKGSTGCDKDGAFEQHVYQLKDSQFLNRYFDEKNTPRPESYREDLHTYSEATKEEKKELYRNLRAACESGWDFSSRWLYDKEELHTIHTLNILPVDLNCLLYHMEHTLSLLLPEKRSYYEKLAKQRRDLILTYFWDAKKHFFFDYFIKEKKCSPRWTLAGCYPLFMGIATKEQAAAVAKHLKEKFLKKGGFVTTLDTSKQQWDLPNGWPPLMWITVQGLLKYGYRELAFEAAKRFLELNRKIFKETGGMYEKYNVVENSIHTQEGEYTLQEGFGWTNGVYLALQNLLQEHQKKNK